MRKLDLEGENFIIGFEGFSSKPYYATPKEKEEGIVTIGYGNTFYADGKKVKITDAPITKEKGLQLFRIITNKFEEIVNSKIRVQINQHQFNALVSHTYNTGGSSTLFNLVNSNASEKGIRDWFVKKYITQGDKVLSGLVRRRIAESNLYFKK